MKNRKLPRTYAQALLETASGDWIGALKQVHDRLEEEGGLKILDDPRTPFAQKEKAIARLLPPGSNSQVKNFLLVLAKENRLSSLGEVLIELEDLVLYGPQAQVAYITSAVPLTPEEEKVIREKLSRRFSNPLTFRFQLDPQILGGVIVQVGDKVIDGSLAGKLQALREKLRGG